VRIQHVGTVVATCCRTPTFTDGPAAVARLAGPAPRSRRAPQAAISAPSPALPTRNSAAAGARHPHHRPRSALPCDSARLVHAVAFRTGPRPGAGPASARGR
jgi:hypothetical protein